MSAARVSLSLGERESISHEAKEFQGDTVSRGFYLVIGIGI